MHKCRVCGATVNFSLAGFVCFVCARKIRAALNRWEDAKAQARYREAGNPRASEHHYLTAHPIEELAVGRLPMDATGMVCREGHELSGRVDHCGQVWCEPCGACMTPRESE